MAFELIPFPISIIFVLVFAVVWMIVLWKLRRTGKIYSFLFKASLMAGVVLFVVILYVIITHMVGWAYYFSSNQAPSSYANSFSDAHEFAHTNRFPYTHFRFNIQTVSNVTSRLTYNNYTILL
jgi:Mn2+/Fe2+ NRAMP family transporter